MCQAAVQSKFFYSCWGIECVGGSRHDRGVEEAFRLALEYAWHERIWIIGKQKGLVIFGTCSAQISGTEGPVPVKYCSMLSHYCVREFVVMITLLS